MKWFKVALLLCSAFLGFFQAFSEAKRVTYVYVNKCNPYVKITGPFDPARCVNPSVNPCYYTITVDLGPTTTKGTLDAAGGTPSSVKKCYI
jgi:hypothetical protein